MALPVSSLSQVCRSIADFVSQGLQASQNKIHVTVGSPAEVAPKKAESNHLVNLFFYRFEPGGFGPAADPDEPWRLRLHCLITAFGVQEQQISAGENELRLLGEVLRIFHEKPVLDPVQVDGEQVRTQVVFQPLTTDEINHLWSTQGDVGYRPSVAYEMALAPVMPSERGVGAPLAGALGFEVRSDLAARRQPFGGTAAPPPVTAATVDTGAPGWAPRICFVTGGACAESLAFAVGSPELADFTPPRVWIAGEAGAPVTLAWEVWSRTDGWTPHEPTTSAAASGPVLDPEAAGSASTEEVPLPFDDRAGQAALHASRTWTRPDGAEVVVRSNPLLVTLYEVDG
ncbi:MAG: DUF4255 domain-containing protein [Acidobacteriota bacterium]|jgi:hypothetical protein